MRYDEKEELEATGEWLWRINQAGFSEELTYVPSRLAELGVAPKDVVDSLEWLRDHKHDTVEVPVEPASAEDQVEPEESIVDESEIESLVLDYDSYGPWEWAGQIENMIEEALRSVLEISPGCPEFNELASQAKNKKGPRARRRVARTLSIRA